MTVITRFAPSPTGMLHIGGARTALFNYLFARHHGGQFKLRIEDTDQARNSAEARQAIIDGLQWLGLTYDGDIVYQSARAERHKQIALDLLARGQAYYCYTTPEELAAQRAAAEAKGEAFRYDRKWRPQETPPPVGGRMEGGRNMAPPHTDKAPLLTSPLRGEELSVPPGVQPSIRIKAPLEGEVVVHDAVQGPVRFGPDALDDMVILRSDGTPTYNLAVVVDDHDMGITHVIRGDDHLNNAGRQTLIYEAMGWKVPVFAHIPLIHGPDGAKLSKRHGATSTVEYANMGYLPEAMRNYLARLGWSHGDDEIFSDAQAIEWFGLDHVGQSPSRLDFAKLNHVNAHYLRQRPDAELAELIIPYLVSAAYSPLEGESKSASVAPRDSVGDNDGITHTDTRANGTAPSPHQIRDADLTLPRGGSGEFSSAQRTLLIRAIPSVKTKAQTLPELAEALRFYLIAPQNYDEKATAALEKGRANLPAILEAMTRLEDWTADAIKAALNELAATTGKKLGELMPPMRAALVGSMSGPDVPVAMEVLGKAETLTRFTRAAG